MQILSVNIGSRRQLTIKNRDVQSGIYKIPVTGPVAVGRFGLQDDVRVEARKMGLEHSAVYAYPHEHYAYWQQRLEREPFPLGQFGENLTVTGLLEEEVRIGDIFRFGSSVLQVAYPRIPCNKLNARMGLKFASMFLASCKVGYYFRVLEEGFVAEGDRIELLERDETSPTMEEFVRVSHYEYWDAEALQSLLQARDLMPDWREIIETKLEQARHANGWHGLRAFELVRREQESEDTLSLYLRCAKGKPLVAFRGGQQLMVVLSRTSTNQLRHPYYLSSSPKDLSAYRITLRHTVAPDSAETAASVSAQLFDLKLGEQILCSAPYGAARSLPEHSLEDRIPVLVSQGLGIAPILSLLYEQEALQIDKILLFHEPESHEPQKLLHEVRELLARNPGYQFIRTSASQQEQVNAVLLQQYAPLAQSNIHVAGSRRFVERMVNELMALDISPAAVLTYNTD